MNETYVPDKKLISFGVGKRRCIGQTLAKEEYFMIATKIIHEFEISLNNASKVEPIQMGTLLAPNNLDLVFKRRS